MIGFRIRLKVFYADSMNSLSAVDSLSAVTNSPSGREIALLCCRY